jgi:NAD(P)-dependent dehydrogenase (short-subunit alcohol dehydrogenase family)
VKLKNRVALITGAGRGIGRALAEGFAREGADVAMVAWTEIDLDQTAEVIRGVGRKGRRLYAKPLSQQEAAGLLR